MTFEYPAVFTVDKEDPGWINVKFPDILCGVTCGKGMDNAIYMAKDLLHLMLTTAPKQCYGASKIEDIKKNYPGAVIVLIEVEVDEVVDC